MRFLNRRNVIGSALFLFSVGACVNIQYNTYLFQEKGLSPHQIGLLSAIGAVPSLITPILAGWLQDRAADPRKLLALLTVLSAAALWALPLLPGTFGAMAAGFAAMQCVFLPISPLVTSILVTRGDSSSQSGFLALRAMGTLGFFLLSVFFSFWTTRERLPGTYLVMAVALLANLPFIAMIQVPPRDATESPAPGFTDVLRLLGRPGLLPIYLSGAVAYLSVNLGQNMTGNLITSPVIGGTARDISRAWSISTLPEILFMFAGIWFLRRFGLRALVLVGILSAAGRWIWASQATSLWEVYASQTLHGIMVVGLMTGESLCLARLLPRELRASGISLAAILNNGLAGIIGSAAAGLIWQRWSIQAVYLTAGLVLLISAAIFWKFVPDLEDSASQSATDC